MGGLTSNNHATCCAAAIANIDIIENEGLVENSAIVGSYLLAQLRATFGNDPRAGEIRGVGMVNAIEWTKPGTKEPAGETPMAFPAAIYDEAKRRGLAVRVLGECIAVAPPLYTTREEIDEIVGILAESVAALSA